jgi:hypothetical protein
VPVLDESQKLLYRAGGPRSLLACVLIAAAFNIARAQPARSLEFDVLLDGKPVGTHRFEVTRTAGGDELVISRARFDVKFLGLVVYRYRHEARERWRDGCLMELEASTDDNGRKLAVRGRADADGFRLSAPREGDSRGGCVAAYAYWDRDRLLQQRELLNPQTGTFDLVKFEALGTERIGAGDAQRPAQRHRLVGEALRIDLWYGEDGRWLQLASPARGDRELLYRLRP